MQQLGALRKSEPRVRPLTRKKAPLAVPFCDGNGWRIIAQGFSPGAKGASRRIQTRPSRAGLAQCRPAGLNTLPLRGSQNFLQPLTAWPKRDSSSLWHRCMTGGRGSLGQPKASRCAILSVTTLRRGDRQRSATPSHSARPRGSTAKAHLQQYQPISGLLGLRPPFGYCRAFHA